MSSLRQLTEMTTLIEVIADLLAGHRGYQVIQQLPGIGPVLAAVITAEIGDVIRFKNPGQLCSWAKLTSRHRESDTKVARGHVTKQGCGSCAGRWSRPSSGTRRLSRRCTRWGVAGCGDRDCRVDHQHPTRKSGMRPGVMDMWSTAVTPGGMIALPRTGWPGRR